MGIENNNVTKKITQPREIKDELKINSEGKKYQFEKGGVYYGGDYLPEPPQEINIDTSTLNQKKVEDAFNLKEKGKN